MSRSSSNTAIAPSDESRLALQHELTAILASTSFRTSRRCQDFLRYVVNETLEGNSDAIKERNIAVAVFERGASYDPSADSIVRVKAVEVRKRLSDFYESNPGREVRIELHPGTYVPLFRFEPAPAEQPVEQRPPSAPVTISGSPHRSRRPLAFIAILAAGLIALTTWMFTDRPRVRPERTVLEQVWVPILETDKTVLLCLPSPIVQEQRQSGKTRQMEQYYVGVGAAHGAALFGSILGAHGRPFQIKVGRDLNFADLKRQPAVMLGAFSSPWGLELTSNLRFRLHPQDRRLEDSHNPSQSWSAVPVDSPSADMTDDYALVSRVLDSGSGQPVLIAGGLRAYGTQAAVEFLSSNELLTNFTRRLEPGWQGQNFQVVLHSTVRGFTPGPPEVIAWHVW